MSEWMAALDGRASEDAAAACRCAAGRLNERKQCSRSTKRAKCADHFLSLPLVLRSFVLDSHATVIGSAAVRLCRALLATSVLLPAG